MDSVVAIERPQKEAKRLSFLDLPAELRNKIYKLHLIDDETSIVILREELSGSAPGLWQPTAKHLRWTPPHLHKVQRDTHRLAITASCHQIREESFSLFLGDNKFKVKFGDKVPSTNDRGLLRDCSRTRSLHLRGWLSYLGDFKAHLCKIAVDLGLIRHDFVPEWLLDTFKDIKVALPRTAVVTITTHVRVQIVQTFGTRAIPPLRVTTDAIDLDDALRTLAISVQRRKNWITSRKEASSMPYTTAMWKRDSIRELEYLAVKLEELWRQLDGDSAWKWNGVGASR